MDFVVGQRWVSQAEPQLGLGIVVDTDGRHITLHFPAAEEDRVYAAHNAPLARIAFQAGDAVQDAEQNEFQVKAIEELRDLLYYLVENESGEENILPETKLSAYVELSSPRQRLLSGQFDKNRAFQLRVATLHYLSERQVSPVRGLFGPRTNLLGHQLYIASEVAQRHAPRVLLADEVGLGKTIEAGMILHYQLHTGVASRALIAVPGALLHQWLVEMLRKFNLHFSLFDKERYDEISAADADINPFETEQLVLCSLEFLAGDASASAAATRAGWDLLIVDEAHHLEWSAERESPASAEYQCVEQLAANSAGLLLLTATPEQVGVASHFARLRLLDPDRFSSLENFLAEQQNYIALNDLLEAIESGVALNDQQRQQLQQFIPDADLSGDKQSIIAQLLDCHGTGRVLFRNTRAAIENFPRRIVHPCALETPSSGDATLYPEQRAPSDWVENDARAIWLLDLLRGLRNEKILLICHHAQTAVDLEKHLHLSAGIRSTAFVENMSIIERDRAAAYFADSDGGAQVMICSEIGSEGRNFQFASHLVLFDLPDNPDLLEQRIGRLDRIGQQHDVQIYVPYLQGTAQEYLFRWYHEGLNAFAESFSAGMAIREKFAQQVLPWQAQEPNPTRADDFEQLLEETRAYTTQLRDELEHGRDRLLERNSFNQAKAASLIKEIEEIDNSETLFSYMELLFDTYGVEQDYHSDHCYILRPTEQMLTADFPGVSEEGLTVTYARDIARVREDMSFLSWEHPLVEGAMELVTQSELGNAAIGSLKLKALPAGSVLLECFYVPNCPAPRYLQLQRYLPAKPVRVLVDAQGKDYSKAIKYAQLNKLRQHVKRSNRPAIIKQLKPILEGMLTQANNIAERQIAELVREARSAVDTHLDAEILRLVQLGERNKAVRPEEIDFVKSQKASADQHLENAAASLQAARIIINTG
ncbi:MAG: RNA polymerase-associated protein RapA [Gammaproteobacteria bacterium]|nr:RNA polymerase-associated protein RapA [Gammaproteobacteria bacterium]NNL11843.1 RNA polymerase-associated protein RapA [Pseudomonadales bacterium]NNM11585.1 RNA polymerase-associated protein RapA [Pseudomonadales bacterium]